MLRKVKNIKKSIEVIDRISNHSKKTIILHPIVTEKLSMQETKQRKLILCLLSKGAC